MWKNSILFVACLLQVTLLVTCDDATTEAITTAKPEPKPEPKSYYSVIAPGTLRSNSHYNVAVSMHEAKQPAELKVGIEGEKFKESKTVTVNPNSVETLQFEIPELTEGTYKLTLEGQSGDDKFSNSTELNFERKFFSTYIQTDKATYKPADLVRFRVLVLDSNTRPFDKLDKKIDVVITDSAQNRIKQFTNIKLEKGVYAGELQLSTFPVLGNWNIEVSVDGQTSQKIFEVAKYVLPKFEVTIDTPRDVSVADGKIRAVIRSKYTYGKPVKGTAKVTVEPSYHIWNVEKQPFAEKTIPIDGKGHAEFDLSELNYTKSDDDRYTYYPPVKMTAVVEEELTGLKQNTTTQITLHRERYRLEPLPNNPHQYEPGVPFKFRVQVVNYDSTPVTDSTDPVILEIEKARRHYWIAEIEKKKDDEEEKKDDQKLQSGVDKQGIATFEITIPTSVNDTYFQVKAKYKDQSSYLGSLSKKVPREGDYFSIDLMTEKPKLGEEVEVKISSNKDIPYLNYQIVGRGNVIKAGHVDLDENTKEHILKITPTFDMIPDCNLMVYYVKNGQLNFEEQVLNFNKELENHVNIEVPEQAKPGEEVNIKVDTDPDSYVGLLGVDQSVLLLKSGNDISESNVFNELREYRTSTPWIRGWGRYPGQSSGLVTMTNAHYPFDERPRYYWRGPVAMGGSRGGAVLYNMPARPMAASVPLPQSHREKIAPPKPIVVRKNFAEIWIWNEKSSINGNGEITIKEKVPDTITSWVLTAFSVNPKTGLGLTKEAAKLRVFQPFFVSTNLPYSIKRGEVVSVPVQCFNYMDKDLDCEITMDNTNKEFEFAEATNEIEEKGVDDESRTKTIRVPAQSGKSTSFLIRPKRVGPLPIKVKAVSPVSGDAIQQMLPVEPEGVTKYENKAVFVNLKESGEQSEIIKIEIPDDAVPDSQYVEVSVVGDLLGPTIKNLDKLVRMPYGCGEQNMVNFVPNILVLKYLTSTNQLTPAIESKAKKYMEVGYQKELTYKHSDGSYSAFGEKSWDGSKANGSTWLTAYVVKSFHQAKPFIDIDQKVIDQGLTFLAGVQTPDGCFQEYGKVLDKAYSGESENGVSLTAYVLLAFLENVESRDKYGQTIEKAVECITKNVEKAGEKDIYAIAIAAYALKLANAKAAAGVSEKLTLLARNEGDRRWWAKPEEEKKEKKENNWWYRPKSADVEQTAYALLSILLDNGPAENTLPVLKWLISKRNSNGGFSSTQDTVVGLSALIEFSKKFSPGKSGKLEIEFSDDTGNSGKIEVNSENSLVLQTHVLSNKAKEVTMKATGTGSSLAQVSYKYNVVSKNTEPRFTITPKVKESKVKDILMLDVCVKYIALDHDVISNMAVVEINLPSGYSTSESDLDAIKNTKTVQRVETKNRETVIDVYFDNIGTEEICIPVEATKTSQVAKQKPAAIEAYDYYNSGNRGIAYYSIVSNLCDICSGDECGDGCKKPENP